MRRWHVQRCVGRASEQVGIVREFTLGGGVASCVATVIRGIVPVTQPQPRGVPSLIHVDFEDLVSMASCTYAIRVFRACCLLHDQYQELPSEKSETPSCLQDIGGLAHSRDSDAAPVLLTRHLSHREGDQWDNRDRPLLGRF